MNKKGVTPLFQAAMSGHFDSVLALLLADAKPNKANADGRTPLSVAIENGHKDVVNILKTPFKQ